MSLAKFAGVRCIQDRETLNFNFGPALVEALDLD